MLEKQAIGIGRLLLRTAAGKLSPAAFTRATGIAYDGAGALGNALEKGMPNLRALFPRDVARSIKRSPAAKEISEIVTTPWSKPYQPSSSSALGDILYYHPKRLDAALKPPVAEASRKPGLFSRIASVFRKPQNPLEIPAEPPGLNQQIFFGQRASPVHANVFQALRAQPAKLPGHPHLPKVIRHSTEGSSYFPTHNEIGIDDLPGRVAALEHELGHFNTMPKDPLELPAYSYNAALHTPAHQRYITHSNRILKNPDLAIGFQRLQNRSFGTKTLQDLKQRSPEAYEQLLLAPTYKDLTPASRAVGLRAEPQQIAKSLGGHKLLREAAAQRAAVERIREISAKRGFSPQEIARRITEYIAKAATVRVGHIETFIENPYLFHFKKNYPIV